MAFVLWSQDKFTKGELSPLMYARMSVEAYYDGLKTASNVIGLPQGAVAKRFGTNYMFDVNSAVTDYTQIYFTTFTIALECTYLIIIRPGAIDIYLENQLMTTVTVNVNYDAYDIPTLNTTSISNRLRVGSQNIRPYDLIRTATTAQLLNNTGWTASTIQLNAAVAAGEVGKVYPARFTTTSSLHVTTPQIKINVTYYIRYQSTTTISVYANCEDAFNDENAFVVTGNGVGTNNLTRLNTWNFTQVNFSVLPVLDFGTVNYSTDVFTVGATGGAGVTLNSANGVFTTAYVGGIFVGNGGLARITSYVSANQVLMDVKTQFADVKPIGGTVALLAEPAWSNTKGWPRVVSAFQNRAVFANTDAVPNGIWLSSINDFQNFDELGGDDDDAIGWIPSSNDITEIRHIVPYRSLTVHGDTGVFSSPLLFDQAVTPTNFNLQIQDGTPAGNITPQSIDNQILVVSGNDVYSMFWDGQNNAYTANLISVMSEQLIRNVIDETVYRNFEQAGSRYLFLINEDGSMAMFQSLLSENIQGWTKATLKQSYGNAYFRYGTADNNGRCWFITERELAIAASPIAITAFTASTLTATGSQFDGDTPTAVKFTTGTSLPPSTPALNTTDFFWVIGVNANDFKVYATQENAQNDENAFVFTDTGTGANVVPYPPTTRFQVEELDFTTYVDCAAKYLEGTATDTVTGVERFNAQEILINGDGFGFRGFGNNDEVPIKAHGVDTDVFEYQAGFGIEVTIEPLPLAIAPQSVKQTTLTQPKHVRAVNFYFNDQIGGYVNNIPIAIQPFASTVPGEPPTPAEGVFSMSVMRGWDDIKNATFTITHEEPFNIRLLGVFYKVEI